MKDFAHERLPRGYELYETVDLAGKAMKVMEDLAGNVSYMMK